MFVKSLDDNDINHKSSETKNYQKSHAELSKTHAEYSKEIAKQK